MPKLQKNLKNMNNDKSPESSGFTVNFYKVFWNQIGHFVLRAINYSLEERCLSITQKQGIW